MSDAVRTTAQKLVDNCREGNAAAGLDDYYAADAISVEAAAGPGADSRETPGLEGIKGKHEWWNSNFEVHSATVDGPFMHGDDRFSVIFELDATNKMDNTRSQMKEVAVYHCNPQGQIVREEFFYNMGG